MAFNKFGVKFKTVEVAVTGRSREEGLTPYMGQEKEKISDGRKVGRAS